MKQYKLKIDEKDTLRIRDQKSDFVSEKLKKACKKYIEPSLTAIDTLIDETDLKVDLVYTGSQTDEIHTCHADITLFNREGLPGINFEINVEEPFKNGSILYDYGYGLDKNFIIYNDHLKLLVDAHSVEEFECDTSTPSRKLKGYLKNLKAENIENKISFFRMIIPFGEGEKIKPTDIISPDGHLIFDIEYFDQQETLIGLAMPSTDGMFIPLNILSNGFHLYSINGIKSICIDSLEKISYEEFLKITKEIRLVFSFLTASDYTEELFILASENKDFKNIQDIAYSTENSSFTGKQQLINPQDFISFLDNPPDQVFLEKFSNCPKKFPAAVFSNFCNLSLNTPVLHRATEILVDNCAIKNPLQQGILASVALETITELIAEENESSLKPIPDKALARQVVKRLQKILTDEFQDIPAEGALILEKKLNALNTPTNKDKLLFPFKLYDIELSESESAILNHCNSFLHGKNPSEEDMWNLEQIALTLHYLSAIVILKYIGYSGHVVYLPNYVLLNNADKLEDKFPNGGRSAEELLANFDPESSSGTLEILEHLKLTIKRLKLITDIFRKI